MHDCTLQVPEIMSVVLEQFSVGQTMEGRDLPIIARGRTFPKTNYAHHIRCPVSQFTCSVPKKVK